MSEASTTYTINTSDDSVDEADWSVTATLQTGSGYTVSTSAGAATVSVTDDDDPPLVVDLDPLTVTVEDATGAEGEELVFTVRLSRASDEQITIRWNTATAWDQHQRAHGSVDYQEVFTGDQDLVFAPGTTEMTGRVLLESDNETGEHDEHFEIQAFLPTTLWPPDATATMTITNNND